MPTGTGTVAEAVGTAESTVPVLAVLARMGDVPAMAVAIVSGSLTREAGMGFGVLIMAMGGIILAGGIIPIVGADGIKCDVVPASVPGR